MSISILKVTFIEQEFVGLGDFDPEIDSDLTGTVGAITFRGDTFSLGGYTHPVYLGATDACFFGNENPGCIEPVWTLIAGELPFGVRLSEVGGVYTVSSSVLLVRGNGPNQFTVQFIDGCGNIFTETYYTTETTVLPTEPPFPPGGSTPSGCWDLGALWTITLTCAYQGTYGLQRTANGISGSSDTSSSGEIAASAGQTYFLSFYAKGSGGADGTIGFGLSFYDTDGLLISSEFVETTGSPTTWTQFLGTVTAPANSVTAIPTIRSTGHLTGTWCVDQLYAILTGGFFQLSSIKHYYDDFCAYR